MLLAVSPYSSLHRLASFSKISITLLFLFFLLPSTKAQNLFFNPDFEELNLCIEYKQLCSSAAWFYIKPAATPLINARTVPQPFNGNDLLIVPIENVYAKVPKHAYVYTKFACPLQKGKKYQFSFCLNTNGNPFFGIDFYMRKKEFLSNNFSADTVVPSIHFDDTALIRNINGWNFIQTTYTAKGDEYFCLLGNLSKTSFNISPIKRMNKAGDIFYFIDNIMCRPLIPEPYCNNYKKNEAIIYGQHLRHTERTETNDEPTLPEFIRDTITVPAVFFETDKAILKPAFKNLINELIIKFKNKNITKIDIEGHTDNTGTPVHNTVLSNERANAVLNYFLLKAPTLRQSIFAYGKAADYPIADNNTVSGRAKNRRVQIILTYTLVTK